MRIIHPDALRDALTPILPAPIAVLGFGNQGRAQALNARDSGCDVRVGVRDVNSRAARAAAAAGLPVMPTPDAVRSARVVCVLLPDEVQPEVFECDVRPFLAADAHVGFAHGFAFHFGLLDPPSGVGVFLVGPKGPGTLVRDRYVAGGGVASLLAIARDPSGQTRPVALGWAAAIGAARVGLIETTFKDETETDLFGEQAVLCGGMSELIRAAFDTLVEAGYPPELAYLECAHEVKQVADLVYAHGVSGMRTRISGTAAYGDLTRGRRIIGPAVRATMREVLAEIRSGKFAAEWVEEHHSGRREMTRLLNVDAAHVIEDVGSALRVELPGLAGPGG